jgi:hypothetical protein
MVAALLSILLRISFVFAMLFSLVAEAAPNAIRMAYNFTTVSQTVVFNSAMQAGGTFTLSTQAMDGGGRAPGDPFTIKMVFYNSSNAIVNTAQLSNTLVYGSATPATYTTTTTNCGGSCANVAYVKVEFYGKDGGFWAGNYGPYIINPSLSFNGGPNILYNPEFGIYGTNGFAQGWTSTAGWQNCALYSGSATCVVNNGAPVNGGTYSASGGSTSGSAGGYTAPPPAPTYSSGITTAQTTRKNSETAQRNAQSGNEIQIEQIGDNNTITIRQGVTISGKNRIELYSNGNYNTLNLNQGYTTTGTVSIGDSNNHYLNLNLIGNNNTITKQQTGTSNFNESTINGNTNNVSNIQQGTGPKVLFQNVSGNNNTVTTNQKDSGQHYLDLKLTGNGHTVGVTQEGTGNHAATIDLINSGGAATLNLNQSGTANQVYSIQQSCVNAAGCSTTVTQP